jgi:hypothetical protein
LIKLEDNGAEKEANEHYPCNRQQSKEAPQGRILLGLFSQKHGVLPFCF